VVPADCNNDPKRALAIVFNAKIGQMPKKITSDVASNLKDKLDAIFASLPRTRVLSLEHFYANKLRVLKMSEPEYKECKNDPKNTLAVAYNARRGQLPKRINYDVVINLGKKLDALFASLPRTRSLTLDTFYAEKLRVLRMPERTREKLRQKEVRGSASAEEAIAGIKDDYARDRHRFSRLLWQRCK
jgi:hypothetical protein